MAAEKRHQKMEARILESLCMTDEMASQGLWLAMSLIGGILNLQIPSVTLLPVPTPLCEDYRNPWKKHLLLSHWSCLCPFCLTDVGKMLERWCWKLCFPLTAHQGQVTRHYSSKQASQRPVFQGQFPGCHTTHQAPAWAPGTLFPHSQWSMEPKAQLSLKLLFLLLQKQWGLNFWSSGEEWKGKRYKNNYLTLMNSLKNFCGKIYVTYKLTFEPFLSTEFIGIKHIHTIV